MYVVLGSLTRQQYVQKVRRLHAPALVPDADGDGRQERLDALRVSCDALRQ